MNKSFLKFVTDIGPLAIFFYFYYMNDKNLKIAIPPLIVATIISVLFDWIIENWMFFAIINLLLLPKI